jgi:hypothetical protein
MESKKMMKSMKMMKMAKMVPPGVPKYVVG